ncbi:MAG: DUF6252 family protein [Bacteroidales bacterium]|nr:DUF6252 family protein [Bacteroidales bacterium]
MKPIQFLKTATLALAVLLSSCAKDDEPTPDSSGGAAFFAAKVDNQSFPNADIQFTSAKFVSSTKMLQIIGQPTDQKETIILILMPFGGKVTTSADWKPGAYDFDPIHVTNVEYLASAEYNKWNGSGYDQWFTEWEYVKTGKIIIETNNGTHIKGTFSFDAVRKNNDGSFNSGSIKKITGGKFDLDIKTY